LERSFAVTSLLIFLATALLLGWAVNWIIKRSIVQEAGHSTSVVANAVVLDRLDGVTLKGPLDDATAREFDRLLERGLADSGVLAIKLWDPEGTLAYSSDDPDAVGESHIEDHELVEALEGETSVEIALEAEEENEAQFASAGSLIEVYAPLVDEEGGSPGGIFEVYLPYAPVQAQIRQASLIVWGIVVAGALFAYAVQTRIVHRAALRLAESEQHAEEIEQRLSASLGRMQEHSLGTLAGLISAVDAKDSYTADHSLCVAEYATAIGVHMGLSDKERQTIERAALLHDVGKIGIPEAILLKPTQLEDAEYEIVKDHSDMGYRIVNAVPFLEDIAPVVRHHHERWDGRGYPDGLDGERIPLLARILAVADAFDAMTSDRPYRRGQDVDVAVEELLRERGTQFDPAVVDAFLTALDRDALSESRKAVRQALVAYG
jgi:putative nucleotidyltransferase with HDIG domain